MAVDPTSHAIPRAPGDRSRVAISGVTIRRLIVLSVALLLGLLSACGNDGEGTGAARPSVQQWQRYEVAIDRPLREDNPFDPAAIAASAEVREPGGQTMQVPAFVNQAYERQLVNGVERLTAHGSRQWLVRITPDRPGRWAWRPRIETAAGVELGAWSEFEVTVAAAGAHGFVRRSRRDARYLEFDDGTPFWAVGENLAWYDARGTYAYDEWIERLAAQGCNYIRLWMPSWAFGLEWTTRAGNGALVSSSLGNYAARLDRAWQLDYVIELARRHGMYVMLSIQNHGAFSLSANSEWSDNPYNAANGGPLQQPAAFFTDPAAKELFKRRLRYIVARWGYAPNLLAWELWNEVDLAEQPAGSAVADWHREMANELRALDPHRHLITTSSSSSRSRDLWALEEIDLTQIHQYSFDGLPLDFTSILPSLAARLRAFGKPVLVSEAGVDSRGPAETIANDPNADGLHDILWSGLIAQSFGAGMTWWWDNVIDPHDLYFHFAPLRQLTAGVDFAAAGFELKQLELGAGSVSITAHVLQGHDTLLAWLKNDAHQWYAPDANLVTPSSLELAGLTTGTWRGNWIDTRSGARSSTGDLATSKGELSLAVPPFQRDVALRLERQR